MFPLPGFIFWIMLRSPPLCFFHFPTFLWENLLHPGTAKSIWFSCTPDYFSFFPSLSQTTTCSFWESLHPKFLLCFGSSGPPPFPHFFFHSDKALGMQGLCCEAPQHFKTRPLKKMTQHYLFKPRSFCTAAGTNVSVRGFELNHFTPSLWSHLTSHPNNLGAASLPHLSPPPNAFRANPHQRNKSWIHML